MKRWIISVVALIWAFSPLAWGKSNQVPSSSSHDVIFLDSNVTILVGSQEPAAVATAAQDLADDFERVLGKKPRIISRNEDAAPVTILIGQSTNLPDTLRPAGLADPESFSISVVTAGGAAGPAKHVVLLAGADMRGTIYAIYEFSEEFLGIDPFYYWTDHQPARRAQIPLPATLNKTFPSPVFKYRGFFINDEDLLTGWAPGDKDHTGISLAVWNRIFETILRLKGNMIAPGTWIFSDEPQIKLAGQRGLIITQHHAIPLGLNVARWPKDVPYNYTANREILEQAWKDAVAGYSRGQEILWTVGLRGLSDVSYVAMDPSLRGDNHALGELISKAIADQIGIVRASYPDAKFITSLWQEGARLVRDGDLKIPPEVTTVWADDGYGNIQDGGEVSQGQGIYYHTAMMNGRASQLSEMTPVERIYSEFGRYIKAGATAYMLVNTSDIRPVPMTTRAAMEAAWKGVPDAPAGGSAADAYYHRWASEEFGERAAAPVAEIYKEYFAAPARTGGRVDHPYGDQNYHTTARRMIMKYMIDFPVYSISGQAPKWVQPRAFGSPIPGMPVPSLAQSAKEEIEKCGDAQPRWDALWKKALAAQPLVAPDRREFYTFHVLAMITINKESNRMLLDISKAIQEAQSGDMTQAQASADAALRALEEIRRLQVQAEYGKWKNWYRGDWLTGVQETRELAQDFANYLKDPVSLLPPPVFWDDWEAYYHIMRYQGDRSADVK